MSPDGPKLIHMFRNPQRVSRAPGSKNPAGPRSAPFTLGRLWLLGLHAKTADPTWSGRTTVAFAWQWAQVNKPCWILRVCNDPARACLCLPRVISNEWVLTAQVQLTTFLIDYLHEETKGAISISFQELLFEGWQVWFPHTAYFLTSSIREICWTTH